MPERGTKTAARIADFMQLLARFIVLVIIIPAAVLLAVYYLLEPVVPDGFYRSMVSLCVAMALSGVIIGRNKRPAIGTAVFLFGMSGLLLLISFYVGILPLTILCFHGIFLTTIASVYNLQNKGELNTATYGTIIYPLVVLAVGSGPLSASVLAMSFGCSLGIILLATATVLLTYLLVVQYVTEQPLLGVLNSMLMALLMGLLFAEMIPSALDIGGRYSVSLVFSAFLGFGLVVSAQTMRKIQQHIREKASQPTRDDENGIRYPAAMYFESESTVEVQSKPTLISDEWIIAEESAHNLSGIGTVIASISIPFLFLILVAKTGWSAEISFLNLFAPLSALLFLLILAPAAVFLRLGKVLRRSKENTMVKAIGVLIVHDSSIISFTWTQFFLWPLYQSLVGSMLLFVLGTTGLFREIRRIWRRVWLGIIHAFRRLKVWIRRNIMFVGIAVDAALTATIVYFLYPLLVTMSGITLSLPFSALGISSFIALLGIAAIPRIRTKIHLIALTWVMLIAACSVLTFWYLHLVLNNSFPFSLSVSGLWLLGTAILLRIGLSRHIVAFPYLLGVTAGLLLINTLGIPLGFFPISLYVALSAVILLAPLLSSEYARFASIVAEKITSLAKKVHKSIRRAVHAISKFFSAAWSHVKKALRTVGTIIYRSFVFFGTLLARFILAVYASLLITALGFIAHYSLNLTLATVDSAAFSQFAVLFFILYLPVLKYRSKTQSPLVIVCLTGLAMSIAVLAFLWTSALPLLVRFSLGACVLVFVMLLGRSEYPQPLQFGIPIATWLSILFFISLQAYYFAIVSYSESISISLAFFVLGLGTLGFKAFKSSNRLITVVYSVLVVPTSVLLTFWTTYNIWISLIPLFLSPVPVFYKQYHQGISLLIKWFHLAIKYAIAFISDHLPYFGALVSFGLSGGLIIIGYPFIVLTIIPSVTISALGFSAFFLFFALFVDISYCKNDRLLTVVAIGFSLALTVLTWSILLPMGLRAYLLSGVILAGSISLTTSYNSLVDSRVKPLLLSCSFLVLLCLELLAVAFPLNLFVIIISYSFLVTPLIPSEWQQKFVCPIAVSSLLGGVFWAFVLPHTSLWLAISGYITIESLLLASYPPTRNWLIWWVFAVASAYSLTLLIGLLTSVAPLIGILWAIEALWINPRAVNRFTKNKTIPDLARSSLWAMIIGFLIYPLVGLLLAIEIGAMTFSAVLYISRSRHLSESMTFGLSAIFVVSTSSMFVTVLYTYTGTNVLKSIIAGGIPIAGFLGYRANFGPYKETCWNVFSGLIASILSMVWLLLYETSLALFLSTPTFIFILSTLQLYQPEAGTKRGPFLLYPIGLLILLLETVWIWHAVLIFELHRMQILAGCALLGVLALSLPVSGALDWRTFEYIWNVIAFSISMTLSLLLSDWSIFSIGFPSNLWLFLSLLLTLYPLTSAPVFYVAESIYGYVEKTPIAHLLWSPALAGWSMFSYGFILMLLNSLRLALSFAALSLSLAAGVFFMLYPGRTQTMFEIVNLSVALAVGSMIWFATETMNLGNLQIPLVVIVSYFVALPALVEPSVRTLRRIYTFLITNKNPIILAIPVVIGVILGFHLCLGSTRPALGLQIRQLLQGIAIAACVMGILYILEIAIIQSDFTANLKRPVIALLGRGSFLFLLGLALPASYPGLLMLSYYLSEALALSLVLMYVLNRAFDFHQSARSIHKLFGIVLGFFAYSYLALFGSLNLFYILVTACAVVFIVESPFLKNEFLALLAFLQNLGTHIITAFRRLVRSLKILFQRFGWITWSSFSIITSFAVGWFTFPLFSDIVAMDPEGILYGIPSLSVPALIMGCLLLVVALARRRVRSSFGIFSVGIVVITSSITSTVWLFDRGFPEFAVLSFALILSMSVFALNLIRYNLNILKISSWISIPFCLSAILFYGIQYFVPVTHGNELGMLLSAILCTSLLLVSTHVRILPLILQKPIWVILAGLTAFTTFQISGLIGFSMLGCIYLAVFVFSWVLFPITRKEFLYLFLTSLFFSLTGFGYTFVFGDFIQSLFLAMAVALLFVSLDIREREKNLAELVYLRLAVLVALVSLLIAFGYSFFLTAF